MKGKSLKLGISTATNFKLRQVIMALECCLLRIPIVEISALKESELSDGYIAFDCLNHLDDVSFHAPDKFRGSTGNMLRDLRRSIGQKPKIILHPHLIDESVDHWLLNNVLIENLDCREVAVDFTHRGQKFLKLIEENPLVDVCFDVAHALSVEPDSNKLIEEIRGYRDRISSIHLSFFDENNKHSKLDRNHSWWNPAKEVLTFIGESQELRVILETPITSMAEITSQLNIAKLLLNDER